MYRHILHWLRVQQQIIFKITVLAFKCIRDTGPGYFNGVCTPLADNSGHVGKVLPNPADHRASASYDYDKRKIQIKVNRKVKLLCNQQLGSAIGPASFVAASDLNTVNPVNKKKKYAEC